ncbi:ABC transporter ATP-binding protein [Pannonibacter phragmitetus]|uniref:ABC transporter ATP-binding protein n=1 Tax=Pannonibacter phragmitetus TaxID=121719 RepID=UPI003D2EBF13
MTHSVSIRNLSVHAGNDVLVRPVSLELASGRPLTILGETGSGKSLLLQAVLGTLPEGLTAMGEVAFEGQRFAAGDADAIRPLWGRLLAILPQEPWLALDPLMRGAEQIRETHALVGRAADAGAVTAEDLKSLGLAGSGTKRPYELSGGMAQRLAFAVARAGGGRLIFADEPTKGLDSARRDDVARMLLEGMGTDGALLTITHDLELARQLGGDFMIMKEGQITDQGRTEDLLSPTRPAYTRKLAQSDPLYWPKRTSTRKDGAPVLTAEGVAASRGGRRLFSGISLAVHPGEITGITGPSGCGKSTLGDILIGLMKPDEGRIERKTASASGSGRPLFQKLYQDPPASFPRHATMQTLLEDLVRLHKLDPARVAPLMKKLGLADLLLTRRADEISGGELQRFSMLRALLLDPVLLFADEPTSRLDPITQKDTFTLLTDIVAEQGLALIVVSHDASLVKAIADNTLQLSAEV